MKKLLLMRTWLLATIAFFAFGSISAQTIIYSADFDQNDDTHQTGNNSYTVDSKSYKASSVDWTITYADVCNPTAAISDYSCIGRVAKNTTNSPTMTTGAIGSAENTITEISYDVKGNGGITVKCFTSTDGNEWTEQHSEAAKTTASNITINNLNITAPIYLKFTGTVESSTKSNRDFAIDNVVVKGISNTLPSITVSPASLDFGKSYYGFWVTDLIVTASNLTEDISVSWKNGINNYFTFDKSIHFSREGGKISITPDFSEVGIYNATLVLTSGSVTTEVPITAEILARPGTGEGTEENPYDVTRAKVVIDALGSASDVYVKGTISKVDSFNETYKSLTYWLDDNTFQVYSGKNINNTDFESVDDLTVGYEVVIKGTIKKYSSTYEFDKNNYIVSIKEASPVDKLTSITLSGEYPTEFNINDAFSHEGLVVTATYTISEDKDVTADAVVDAPDMTTKGTKTVTVSYTEGETTVTKTYTINVVDPNVTYVMLVGKAQNGKYYAVSNETGKGTKSLAAVEVVVVNNKVLTNEVNDNLLWMVDGANIVSKNGTYLSSGTDNANLSTSDTAFEWKWVEDGGYWANGDRPILGIDDEKGNYYFKAYAKSNIGKHVNNNGYYFAKPAVEMAYEIADVTTEGEHTIIDVVVEDASTLPDNHIAKDNDGNWVANKIVINDEKGHGLNREVVANNVEYLRELSGEAWSAICLPFDVDATTLEDYAVLELQGVENGMVVFAYAEAMAAHTPYLICKKDNSENGNVDFKLANTTVKSAAAAEKTTSTAKMVGVYTAKRIPAGCYGLAGGVFRKAADDNDNELKPFRAYLVLTNAPQGAQMMSISIDDQATGIENINIADEVIFYDLQGRRVNNPSKGIFIMNGKKVIIK